MYCMHSTARRAGAPNERSPALLPGNESTSNSNRPEKINIETCYTSTLSSGREVLSSADPTPCSATLHQRAGGRIYFFSLLKYANRSTPATAPDRTNNKRSFVRKALRQRLKLRLRFHGGRLHTQSDNVTSIVSTKKNSPQRTCRYWPAHFPNGRP